MRKLAVLLVVSTALSAFAAQGTQVSYRSGSDTVRAMLYRPTGKGLFPATDRAHGDSCSSAR